MESGKIADCAPGIPAGYSEAVHDLSEFSTALYMNDVPKGTPRRPEVPEEMQARWQQFVDLLARILGAPAGLIRGGNSRGIEVFLSSATEGNPFQRGQCLDGDTGLCCERVLNDRAPLLVSDALKDPAWDRNPAIRLGMTDCLGFPILWPDNEMFGTLCVFDRKDHAQATQFQELLALFRQLIEKDLCALVEMGERDDLLAELQRHRDRLREMTAEQTAELEKSKAMLEERIRFEYLISDLSAGFLNVPPERAADEIALILDRVCQFFGADHCRLQEVLADRRQIKLVHMDLHEEGRREALDADIVPGRPWAYHQLVELGEPVVFSSLEALPPEASVDRATWEHEGVRALLMLPLRIGGQVTHVIALRSHHPHDWPVVHIRRLRVLGELFAGAMIRRRNEEALLKSERGLAEAQRIAHVGSWEYDLATGKLQWSDEVYRMFGLPPRELRATYNVFLALVHPDDRGAIEQAVADALADPQKGFSVEHRVVRPDGSERIVRAQGEVLRDANEKPVRMIGAVVDMTTRKQTEEALREALAEIQGYKDRLEAENIYLREEIGLGKGFAEIVGVSDAIRYVQFRIQQVAPTKATALLTGETGTGKGAFAHALHAASDRKEKPFVHVNCAGLPPNLIESELFGREKGAFTGSTARQIGRFELANGGTIYLDEIAELSRDLQAKLLRVVEAGEFERLGSPHVVKVDVRIIASTNRNLDEEMRKGRFRKDLFYRLSVFPITIPPLRKRKEDIPVLVKFYADRFSKSYAKDIRRIPKETMQALENYCWPGNVRELINVIERAVIVSNGPELRLAEPFDPVPIDPVRETASQGMEARGTKGLVEVERAHILRTLRETAWRIEGHTGAAQRLGLNPSTMRARMRKLGIKRPTPH